MIFPLFPSSFFTVNLGFCCLRSYCWGVCVCSVSQWRKLGLDSIFWITKRNRMTVWYLNISKGKKRPSRRLRCASLQEASVLTSSGCHMTNMETKKGKKEDRSEGGPRFPFPFQVPFFITWNCKSMIEWHQHLWWKRNRTRECMRRKLRAHPLELTNAVWASCS